jgi:hypothetical protein
LKLQELWIWDADFNLEDIEHIPEIIEMDALLRKKRSQKAE